MSLGHNQAACTALIGCGNGLAVAPQAAGIAITADGTTLVVANYYNDSISILKNTTGSWQKTAELDLRPGKINAANSGVPGGEYPLWVQIAGSNTAYVSSLRDREVDVVSLSGTPAVSKKIALKGQPGKMILNRAQTMLYVAEDESDSVAAINTTNNSLVTDISAGPPARLLKTNAELPTGNNTNSVTLSADEQTLYVTNGNTNNVAVIDLSNTQGGPHVTGLIPTGWYPNSVSVAHGYMYGQADDQNLPISNTVDRYSFNSVSFPGLSYPLDPFLAYAEYGGLGVISPRDLDRNRKDDYVSAWTLSVQQTLPLKLVATASYLGNKATDVLTTTYANLAQPPANIVPYPAFGVVSWRGDVGNSTFEALQLNVRRAFQNGFLVSSNYMWSHSINDGSVGGGDSDAAELLLPLLR